MSSTEENTDNWSEKSDQHWREQLTPEQFHVTRKKGTERAYSGEHWDSKASGVYRCVCCRLPLFESEAKYDSGTGWPSFYQPSDEDNISAVEERTFFLGRRTEVLCARCDAHLGHVFPDGPAPTGMRYCINSVALELEVDAPNEQEPDGRGQEPDLRENDA